MEEYKNNFTAISNNDANSNSSNQSSGPSNRDSKITKSWT